MLDYINGKIAELTPTAVVIDNAGIGYDINITLIDYASLESEREAKLYVHESIREDAHILYGFLTKNCRELFRLLIGVSGVGPGTARLILSGMTTEQLQQVISEGDVKSLKCIKGIGARTAERIIVDLRDKIKVDVATLIKGADILSENYNDSLNALIMLGFTSQQSQKALKKVFESNSGLTTEKAIKEALKLL